MAPPPEYDKEPKAPDKSATNISCDEAKALHNLVNDQQTNSDNKASSTAASADIENNKLVETLDDGQLRALLDEAITYKCPKDREGKSSLFKELLEEVEQDEQASEAAARSVGRSVNRACAVTSGRGNRSRRALPHSNSLQDLVAALAAEPAPRRHHRAPPAPAPAPVSARAIHGGSLPSGVDTSFLLGEEPARGAGYLATVRCVNPPPLAERRVSTDASCNELDSLSRRSKPAFPMTYTARATLEIGSGAVSSGRAVTTTTASNQVRTMPARHHHPRLPPHRRTALTAGPPERLYPQKRLYYPMRFKRRKKVMLSGKDDVTDKVVDNENETPFNMMNTVIENTDNDNNEMCEPIDSSNTEINVIEEDDEKSSSGNDVESDLNRELEDNIDPKQFKLLSALFPKMSCDNAENNGGGSKTSKKRITNKKNKPRGPKSEAQTICQQDLGEATITSKAQNTESTIPNLATIDINEVGATATEKKDSKTSSVTDQENIVAKNKVDIKTYPVTENKTKPVTGKLNETKTVSNSDAWQKNVNSWYGGLYDYYIGNYHYEEENYSSHQVLFEDPQPSKPLEKTEALLRKLDERENKLLGKSENLKSGPSNASSNILYQNIAPSEDIYSWAKYYPSQAALSFPLKSANHMQKKAKNANQVNVANVKQMGNKPDALSAQSQQQNSINTKNKAKAKNDNKANIANVKQMGNKPVALSAQSQQQNSINTKNKAKSKNDNKANIANVKQMGNKPVALSAQSHQQNPINTKNKAKTINDNKVNIANVKKIGKKSVPAFALRYHEDENMRWVLDTHIEPFNTTDYEQLHTTDSFRDNYDYDYLDRSRREYRDRIGKFLVAPKLDDIINPRNVRNMSIGKPLSSYKEFDISIEDDIIESKENTEDKTSKISGVELPSDDEKNQDVLSIEKISEDESSKFSGVELLANDEKSQNVLSIDKIKDETSKFSEVELPTDDEKDQDVLSINKISTSSENCARVDGKDNKGNELPELNWPTHDGEDQLLASSSDDTNKMQDDLEEFYDTEDVLANLSIRSSTPIPEQISLANELSDAIVVENNTKVASSESSSKIEGTSLIGNDKRKKGTVIPLVNQPDTVSIDNNEHLCSSSQEKDPSSEKEKLDLQQQADLYTELYNVNPIQNNKTLNQEQDVELTDMSSHTYEVSNLFRNNVEELTKFDNFSDGCEDITLSKKIAEREKIWKSDASFYNDVELADLSSSSHKLQDLNLEIVEEDTVLDNSNKRDENSFSKYLEEQQRLFQALEDSNLVDSAQKHSLVDSVQEHSLASNISSLVSSEKVHNSIKDQLDNVSNNENVEEETESQENVPNLVLNITDLAANCKVLVIKKNLQGQIVLTLPEMFLNDSSKKTIPKAIEYDYEEKSNNILHSLLGQQQNDNNKPNNEKSKLKKKKSSILEKTKLETANKKALKALMFEKPSQSSRHDKSMSTSSVSIEEVDSAIPFSCITTPEVVTSCNTTSSTQQSAVAVDPKPLQLASSYRAVASLVDGPAPAPAPRAATPPLDTPASLAPRHVAAQAQPRGVIASSFNGLPLSRPNYGSTGNTSQDEYKKSIDENGNSVQGFSSPLSGSSQHKKPRRKKSSKNETVIKSHQIDGYQGNKDLNEVLRFIESAADTTRAGKLGRAKHRDDADDKGGKKRSGTRKDKESKMKRATSMEELSLSRMEDLTDKPSPPARQPRHSDQAKAERRSWGDDARDATTRFFREEPIDVPVVPDTEFQTVTKKRKPRRRADEAPEPQEPAGGDPPRARPPEPRARRVSAPPSDRSNDSNDDMDSVHSLPADAVVGRAPVPAPISYADIARTRHNIPDLIESCNFYSEPERDRSERDRGLPVTETPLVPLPTPGDVDAYPALEPRGRRTQPATKPQQTPVPRRDRKVERTESVATNVCAVSCCMVPEWSAPDVVADRRPAVILLDSCARPRDMDGVTFGFDINETLLGGPARRPRCDLLRDALEGTAPPDTNGAAPDAPAPPAPPAPPAGGVGVAVGGACGALRYVPPAPPSDTVHLHQIIDYVGAAWEDVMRLGAGKVRYYSE